MTNRNLINGFIAYLPKQGDSHTTEAAQVREQIRKLGYTLLHSESYLLAADGSATGSELFLDVFPGTSRSSRLAGIGIDGTTTIEQLHRQAENSAQCYNILRCTRTSFAMESDALGLKPVHIAETAGGYLLASTITNMLHVFPALATPADTVALYELMVFRSALAERTLHRRIRRTLPGGSYTWTLDDGLQAARTRQLRPAPVEPIVFMDQAMAAVHDISTQALLDKTAGAAQPIPIAFSGGFDSRFMAALCREQNIDIRALSYGRRQNEEWQSARACAKALGLKLEMLHYQSDNTLQQLDRHLQTVEGTADPATSQILNLLQASLPFGSQILHGYLGDPLAGNMVNRFTSPEYSSRDSLADGILRFFGARARPALLNLFQPAVDLEEIHQDVLSGLRHDCPPHQAYLCWDMEHRQRRYVASHFSMLGEQFDTVMPFYDRRLFSLWTSMPPAALNNREIFRQMLARYYPALARIPHPEQPAPITPNLRWQLGRLWRSLPRRALASALGDDRAKDIQLRFFRHDYIWNIGNLAAPQQRAYMLSRVGELQPMLKQSLGISLSDGFERVLSQELQALRGVFLAAEYARHQAPVINRATPPAA